MCETHRGLGSKQELRVERQKWQPSLGGGTAVLDYRDGTRGESMRLLGNASEETVVPAAPKPTVVQKQVVPKMEAVPVVPMQPVQPVAKPAPVAAKAPVSQPAAPYVEPKPKAALALSEMESARAVGIVSRLEAQLRRYPQHQTKNRKFAKDQAVQDICAAAGLTTSASYATAMSVLKRCENGAEAMRLFQQLMSKQ